VRSVAAAAVRSVAAGSLALSPISRCSSASAGPGGVCVCVCVCLCVCLCECVCLFVCVVLCCVVLCVASVGA
jgi:hypothetical protein